MEELNCALCLEMLFRPVTINCGHSFCQICLVNSLRHSMACPTCRRTCAVDIRNPPVNIVLQQIIEKQFPDETARRREEFQQMWRQEPVRPSNKIPVLIVKDVQCFPGSINKFNLSQDRHQELVQTFLYRDAHAKFGLLSVINGQCCGTLQEIIQIGPIRGGYQVVTKSQERFRVVNIQNIHDDTDTIGVDNISEALDNSREYCTNPIWISDIDEEQNEEGKIVDEFLQQCIQRCGVTEVLQLNSWVIKEGNKSSFIAGTLLEIPNDLYLELFQSSSESERSIKLWTFTRSKLPSKICLRLPKRGINSAKGTIVLMFAVIIFVLYYSYSNKHFK